MLSFSCNNYSRYFVFRQYFHQMSLFDVQPTSSSLYMPETDAVSHGDANLAVNDFLTRTPL